MNIYFPLETQQRELDARIVFCIEAAEKGHKSYMGHKADIYPVFTHLKKGIYIHKSIQKRKLSQINYLKNLGHYSCSIDEEAIMIPDEEEYFNHRCAKECISALDLFLAWGKQHKNLIQNKYPELKDKIISAGNSRIDVLKSKENYVIPAKTIKQKYGDFFLFVTKFGRHNLKKRGWDTWVEMKLANSPNLSKRSYERILSSIEFEKKNMNLFMETILKLADEYPSKNILIRPHPTENINTWKKFAESSGYSNIKVVFTSQSINPWLIAAEKVISINCTSSLESALLGKISLNYIPYINEEMEYDLPKACSKTIRNYDQLRESINNSTEFKLNRKHLENYINNSEKKSFCHYLLSYLEANINTSIYSEKNKYPIKAIFWVQKIYKELRKKISLYFGPMRRRRNIVKQKCPGFNLSYIRKTANLYKIPHNIIIKEVWPGVYCFEKS